MAPDETGMEKVLSDLQALKGLYGLLHRGQQANENLDEASRSLLMRMLDNATQQALLEQAKLLPGFLLSTALERKLSIQPGRRTGGDADAHAREWSRRLEPQNSARSREDHHRRARDDPLPARVVSNRSSITAMPRLHPSTPQQHLARLGSHRSYRVAEPRLRRGSGRGDRSSSSPESSRRRRYVSREPSTARLLGSATARGVGAGGSSTSRRVGRLDSRLSMGGVTSRCGSGRAARRGEATPRRSPSSSDGEAATIRSRIRPNRELMECCVRRAEEIEELSPRRRRKKDGTVRSGVSIGMSSHRPRRELGRIDSGSTYSSGSSSSSASIPSPSTIPTAPSTLGASASPCSSSSVSVSPRGGARPEYPFEEESSKSRSRRRRERQERREGRLRRFKNKLALVFHHRHDHHHHHHIGRGGSPSSRRDRRGKNSAQVAVELPRRDVPPPHCRTRNRQEEEHESDGGDGEEARRRQWARPLAVRRAGEAQVESAKGGASSGEVRTRSMSKMHWWQAAAAEAMARPGRG